MKKCECGSVIFIATMVTTANIKVTIESGQPEYISEAEESKIIEFSGIFVCSECKKGYSDISCNYDGENTAARRCICGNTRFTAGQVCYHDIIVDSYNDFARDIAISEAEKPYGPYRCTECDAEYEKLDELDKNNAGNNVAEKSIILKQEMPNGTALTAELNNDPNYPGIQISLKGSGSDNTGETVCFVEFNTKKPKGKELCICAYTSGQDEPAYYAGYHDTDENQETE